MSALDQKQEVATIPAGIHITIMGCRLTLLEETKVEANQADLDYILKDQQHWDSQPKSGLVCSGFIGSGK
jgi:hypothetical protein